MTIYAEQIGAINNKLSNLRIELISPIPDKATLVYDSTKCVFVLKAPNETYPAVTGAKNLGDYNSHGVFSYKDGSILAFKEIMAGSGIHITANEEKLVIHSNVAADRLSVPGSYRITIDNDNNTFEDAKFEIFTARSTTENPLIIVQSCLLPVMVNHLYTENDCDNGMLISVDDVDFIAYGFRKDMWISVKGTQSQDGHWQIKDVMNEWRDDCDKTKLYSKIILTKKFEGSFSFNLGGPQYPTIISQADLCVLEPDPNAKIPFDKTKKYVLQSYSMDFGPDGYDLRTGMIFNLKGTQADLDNKTSNDGNYTIYKVTPKTETELSTIIVSPANPFPGKAGPLIEPDPESPIIKLTLRDSEVSTGFEVTEKGNMTANKIFAYEMIKMGSPEKDSLIPRENNDIVRKDYIDSFVKPTSSKPRMMFNSYLSL